MNDAHTILSEAHLLRSLSSEQIEAIAGSSRLVVAHRGETIWLHGSEVDFFGVIDSGFVKMSRTDAHGHEMIVELFGPRQVFGLMGVVDGVGCPMSASAVTTVRYLRVRKGAVVDAIQFNHVFKDELLKKAARRMHEKLDLMIRLTTGTVESRIAAVLCVLLQSYGELDESGASILRVPLTRQEISELAGTTTESAIRVMSRWQKEGWVTTHDHHLIIDEKRLENTALS